MTSATTSSSTRTISLGGRMALEWRRLRLRPDVLARARSWRIVDGRLDDLDQLLDATGYESSRLGDADDRLRRLVIIAAHDELAARVVMQRILPGLLAVVRRRRRHGAGPTAFEELLGAAWISVRTYNPGRRPTSIAAALISDADYRAFRSAGRRRSSDERPTDIDSLRATPAATVTNPVVELAELFRMAADAGVPEDDLDLLRRLLDAPTVNELARDLRITPRTIRNRRDRIALRLREVALAA